MSERERFLSGFSPLPADFVLPERIARDYDVESCLRCREDGGFALRLTLYCLTLFVTAMGVFLCVKTDLVLTPVDGIVKTISEVFHVVFSRVKTALTSPWWPSAPCSAS